MNAKQILFLEWKLFDSKINSEPFFDIVLKEKHNFRF